MIFSKYMPNIHLEERLSAVCGRRQGDCWLSVHSLFTALSRSAPSHELAHLTQQLGPGRQARHDLLTLKCFQRFFPPNKRKVNILGEPISLFTSGMTGKLLNLYGRTLLPCKMGDNNSI